MIKNINKMWNKTKGVITASRMKQIFKVKKTILDITEVAITIVLIAL